MTLNAKMTDPSASVYVDLEKAYGKDAFDPTIPAPAPATAPDWHSSDESVATVTPTGDGWTAEVRYVSPGTAKILAVWEQDDGAKVVHSGSVTVESGDEVVKGTLKFIEGAQGAPPSKQ